MDENTKKALRNVIVFTAVKIAILYGIQKAVARTLEQKQ